MHPDSYNQQLVTTMRVRLDELKMQQALKGFDTPPHIVIEIEQLEDRIWNLTHGSQGVMSKEVLETLNPVERWQRLYDAIWELEVIMYTLQKNIEKDRKNIQDRHEQFNKHIQRGIFETELIKRNNKRLHYVVVVIGVIIIVLQFIEAIVWK